MKLFKTIPALIVALAFLSAPIAKADHTAAHTDAQKVEAAKTDATAGAAAADHHDHGKDKTECEHCKKGHKCKDCKDGKECKDCKDKKKHCEHCDKDKHDQAMKDVNKAKIKKTEAREENEK